MWGNSNFPKLLRVKAGLMRDVSHCVPSCPQRKQFQLCFAIQVDVYMVNFTFQEVVLNETTVSSGSKLLLKTWSQKGSTAIETRNSKPNSSAAQKLTGGSGGWGEGCCVRNLKIQTGANMEIHAVNKRGRFWGVFRSVLQVFRQM